MSVNEWGVPIAQSKNEPIEEGRFDATIHAIVRLGRQKVYKWEGKAFSTTDYTVKLQNKIIFEVPDSKRESDPTTPNVISKDLNVTSSLEKGAYAKFLQAAGEKLNSVNDLLSFFSKEGSEKLLGKGVSLAIIRKEGKHGVYARIDEITRLDPRLPQPVSVRDTFYFDPFKPDIDIFKDKLTYYTKETIMKSVDSDLFPKELHEAWRDAQVEKASREQEYGSKAKSSVGTTSSVSGSTESIE